MNKINTLKTLRVSERRLQQLVKSGVIKRNGYGDNRDYSDTDIENYLNKRDSIDISLQTTALAVREPEKQAGRKPPPYVPLQDKLLLRVPELSAISGLSQTRIRMLIKSGKIKVVNDNGYKTTLSEIEKWINAALNH